MSIRLFNSAGGYIDLESGGNGSTANVFTLPAETGTILTSASSLAAASLTGNVASARIVSALNAEGSAPIYACRAWVNFDGDPVAIREDGNVSSITDAGTGYYRINFSTSMPDANFAVTWECDQVMPYVPNSNTTGYCEVQARNGSNVDVDSQAGYVAVFR